MLSRSKKKRRVNVKYLSLRANIIFRSFILNDRQEISLLRRISTYPYTVQLFIFQFESESSCKSKQSYVCSVLPVVYVSGLFKSGIHPAGVLTLFNEINVDIMFQNIL